MSNTGVLVWSNVAADYGLTGGYMPKLKDKVQTALDEARMLILGSQVLLGFQFRSAFEGGFEKLPHYAQYLKLGGLGLMIIAVGLLMTPGAYHQITEEGEDTEEVHSLTTLIMDAALLPFALGLGIDAFVAAEKVIGTAAGIFAGIFTCLFALFFWYGLEAVRRSERGPAIEEKKAMDGHKKDSDSEASKLKDKIKHVLTEARVVLPGAQALLGFQFATILMEGFEKLPESSKYIHLGSLAMVGISIVFLMTPAAYHRLVERGQESEHFHRFSGRMLISAMVPLALGISGDFFVVARKVTESEVFALACAAAFVLLFYGLWFGMTLYSKTRREARSQAVGRQEPKAA
jgi:hypothetical protein